MIDVFKMIFGNQVNIIFWVIIFSVWIMVMKLEVDAENVSIKFIILYVFLYVISLFQIVDIKIIYLIFLVISFAFLEIIFLDSFAKKIILKKRYYIYDYFYKIIFEYKVLYFFIAIFIISNFCKSFVKKVPLVNDLYLFLVEKINFNFGKYLLIFISIGLMLKCIIRISNNRFKTMSFEQISKEMDTVLPFSNFSISSTLKDFSKILIYKEDRSFLERKNSYNWISYEFIKYRIKRIYKSSDKFGSCKFKILGSFLHNIYFLICLFDKFLILICDTIKFVSQIVVKVIIGRKNIKNYLRGYSTIEMQLIRTIAVKDGYATNIYQRKAYEFIYSNIYFDSLKSYYIYHVYENIQYYKYYLINLYILIAPVEINGKKYTSILSLFDKKDIFDISLEEFYIWTLGLSHRKINDRILDGDIVRSYRMDYTKLKQLIKRFNS